MALSLDIVFPCQSTYRHDHFNDSHIHSLAYIKRNNLYHSITQVVSQHVTKYFSAYNELFHLGETNYSTKRNNLFIRSLGNFSAMNVRSCNERAEKSIITCHNDIIKEKPDSHYCKPGFSYYQK